MWKTLKSVVRPQGRYKLVTSVMSTLTKHGYGLPDEMLEWLDPKAEYDIVGCDLDACVLAACFQLWDRGIRFNILSEYIYTSYTYGFTHENARMVMRKNFGDRYCRNTAKLFRDRKWSL